MYKILIGVEGMACAMCEAHINDCLRKAFPLKKVTSSRTKKQTELIIEEPVNEEALRQAIAHAGYTVTSFEMSPYEKKKFFLFRT